MAAHSDAERAFWREVDARPDTGLNRYIGQALELERIRRARRDEVRNAAEVRAGYVAAGGDVTRCYSCGKHSPELIPAYGRNYCDACYWEDEPGTLRYKAAREVAAELGCDISEILA